MSVSEDNPRDISEVLGLDEAPRGRRRVKLAVALVLFVSIIAAVVWYTATRTSTAIQYKTARSHTRQSHRDGHGDGNRAAGQSSRRRYRDIRNHQDG